MSVESGRVVGIEEHHLWIETISQSSCSRCVAQKGCGQGLLNRYASGRRNHLKVAMGGFSRQDFHLDDQVDISLPDHRLLGAALVVYLLPLFSMMGVMLLAGQFSAADSASIFGAVVGFLLGLLLVKLHGRAVASRPGYLPRVVAVHRAAQRPEQWIPTVTG